MTLDEINITIEANNKRIEQQHYMNYEVAILTADFVNRSFNGKKLPAYNEVFKSSAVDENNSSMDFIKDQWKIFADRTQKQFNGGLNE